MHGTRDALTQQQVGMVPAVGRVSALKEPDLICCSAVGTGVGVRTTVFVAASPRCHANT